MTTNPTGTTALPGAQSAPARAGRRERTALGVLMLPLLLVSTDVSVLYVATPVISADLRPIGRLHHPVPPVRPGQEPAGGGAVEPAAVGPHRRRRAGHHAARPAGRLSRTPRRLRFRGRCRRFRAARARRHRLPLAGAGRGRRARQRGGHGDVPAHRPRDEQRAGGAGGHRLLVAGDRQRVRRRARHGGPRLCRCGGLPPHDAGHRPGRGPRDPGRCEAAASRLPDRTGASLAAAAREAFTSSMHGAALVGMVILGLAAVGAAVTLRTIRVGQN